MYVWGRMLRVLATRHRRGRFRVGDESRLRFRCLPTDIDPNMHLNNARYMMLADMGRLDIFFRSGLMALAKRNGWGPMMGGLQSVYVREIKLWRGFEIVSTMDAWEGTQVLGRHRFILDDGRTAAILMTTAGVYDFRNRRFLPIVDVAAALGHRVRSRPFDEAEQAFMRSHANLRIEGKRGG
ncbi:MAG: thioesterase family protein [Rhizobiaceae bacterium]